MKNKSQSIGMLLIIAALLMMLKLDKGKVNDEEKTSSFASENIEMTSNELGINEEILQSEFLEKNPGNNESEQLFILENDVLKVAVSSLGGTIKSAELKKYKAVQGQEDVITFNEGSKINALALCTGTLNLENLLHLDTFGVVSSSSTSISFQKTTANGCVVTRKYSLAAQDKKTSDGYVIRHETTLENTAEETVNIENIYLFLGAMPAIESDSIGDYLNFGTFNGKKDNFIKLRDFKASSGFFGLGKRYERKRIYSDEKILWGSVKNQFFTAVLTPESCADGYATMPLPICGHSGKSEEGIAGALIFKGETLKQGEQKSLISEFYVGPKDFSRLSALGKEQDRVMQFGFFGSISELLLRMMIKIHAIIPNWGWTIIILTTMVKLLLWPLTNAQVRSSKKMSAIQQPLKLIKEKFKNNPQKLQAETLKLFKENHINPAAGCLPIFIQIPIFFGLYYMLRTASDLRFAHFLWIKDLSLPDTIAHIGHFPVNILPIVMGITMFWQMHMTPMPTSDNSQKLMFRLMPMIFFLCCYNFPSGLVLYWTVQNLLTIAQQWTTTAFGTTKISIAPKSPNSPLNKTRNLNTKKQKGKNVRP